jgi:hypothetical protein
MGETPRKPRLCLCQYFINLGQSPTAVLITRPRQHGCRALPKADVLFMDILVN